MTPVEFDLATFLRACDPCAEQCQYALQVGMPEAKCSGVCQYATPPATPNKDLP